MVTRLTDVTAVTFVFKATLSRDDGAFVLVHLHLSLSLNWEKVQRQRKKEALLSSAQQSICHDFMFHQFLFTSFHGSNQKLSLV